MPDPWKIDGEKRYKSPGRQIKSRLKRSLDPAFDRGGSIYKFSRSRKRKSKTTYKLSEDEKDEIKKVTVLIPNFSGITEVRIYKGDWENVKAYAAVTLGDAYTIHGFKILKDKSDNLWVSMPAFKDKNGEYKDIFHPITKEAREVLVETIISAYDITKNQQCKK